jgi:membrane fusion protein, multidrug efflux system
MIMKYDLHLICYLLFLSACSSNGGGNKNTDLKKTEPLHYSITRVEKSNLTDKIKLPGQLEAFEEVSIFPKVNGYVKNVMVDIGSSVHQGQLLMELEAPELLQATLSAKEKYAKSRADYMIDRERYKRLLEASGTAGAISPLDLSEMKSKMEADSALSNAEKSNWQMQEVMQTYLTVTAPFSGVITERNVHPGALVSATVKDKPMLELKEIDHLRLEVDIPENLAVNLKIKDSISFYTSAMPGKRMTGFLSRKSMNVNTQYRTERMEIDVHNIDRVLSPGMYADVMIYSNGNVNMLSVPSTAVITNTERKYVIKVVNHKAHLVDVSTANSADGKVEIFGNLNAGDEIVSHASEDIREGDIIK